MLEPTPQQAAKAWLATYLCSRGGVASTAAILADSHAAHVAYDDLISAAATFGVTIDLAARTWALTDATLDRDGRERRAYRTR